MKGWDGESNIHRLPARWNFLIILFITALFTLSYAGKPAGMMGGLSRTDGPSAPVENFNYILELFPGQVFGGWWYFWAGTDPLTAQLQESPEVSWLAVTPSSFTSDTCTDVVEVSFLFTAPSTPGIYTTTIIDQNSNWANLPVTISVTNAPLSAWEEYVEINPGQSFTSYDTLYYNPADFEGIGCSPVYTPPTPAVVVYTLVPQVSWLTIQPSQMTIGPTDTFIVAETFSNNTPGDYSCYEIWTAQYFSWPEFTLWNLSVLTDISDPAVSEVPQKFEIFQNYPNPFNPVTRIRYAIPRHSHVKIAVFNTLGKQVALLEDEAKPAGYYTTEFDASRYSNGIYFARIVAGNYTGVIKMLLAK